MNKRRWLLLLILTIGTLSRLTGLGSNIPYGGIYHPDTPKQVLAARDFINGIYYTAHTHPDFRGYPMFTMHIVEWVFRTARGLFFLVAFIFGMHNEIDNAGFNILYIYLLARFILAVFSILTIYLTYKIGSILFNPKVGILASLLFSLSPLSSSLCKFAMGDTAMVFFVTCATYYSCRIITKGRIRDYFLAGLFTMFAFSAKYNGAIIGILPVLALLYKRDKIIISTSVLLLGSILGLFIGNPHLLLHLKEGIVDILCFLKHTSNSGLASEELEMPRLLIAKAHLKENFHMLIGCFQLPVSILGLFALLYIIRRLNSRYLFIATFPIVYLLLAFYTKPSLQPLYILPIFPHIFILTGILIDSLHRTLLYGIYILSLITYAYNSFIEDYFFWHKDTRQIAKEWVRVNIPPQSNIGISGYSISNPHQKSISPPMANFFVSSSLSGMYIPGHAIVIKEFSLENKIPPIIHRNPNIKISVIPGKGIKNGFYIPEFGKPTIKWPNPIFIFLNGVELGPSKEDIMLRKKEGRSITYVSDKPIRNITVKITNGNSKAKVRVNNRVIKLKPNETSSIVIKKPRRSSPHTKYFYRLYIKNITGNEALFQFSTEARCPKPVRAHNKKEFYKLTRINPDILRIVNTQTFEAEEMLYGDNETVWNHIYSNGHAVILKDKSLLWGPYQFYTKGYYIASFTVYAVEETSIRLEVVSDGGKTILAEKELKITESMEILLPFEVKETASVLEFKVEVVGQKPILIDKIDVYPNLIPNVHLHGGH